MQQHGSVFDHGHTNTGTVVSRLSTRKQAVLCYILRYEERHVLHAYTCEKRDS